MNTIFVADIVEKNGLTVRENNLKVKHKIPLGSLVEVDIEGHEENGVRLFVISHDRDCDGTPLDGSVTGGFSEYSLIVIE